MAAFHASVLHIMDSFSSSTLGTAYNPNIDPAAYRGSHVIDQDWAAYTPEEHQVWDTLFERQSALLHGRATPEFLCGLEFLRLDNKGIPKLELLNNRLRAATGWEVVAVPGLVPEAVFFEHLANRRFPAGRFIRKVDQLDYLEEPDIFHDVFGHVPMLADPVYADYMVAYGQGGLRALGFDALECLARLYWYTVEFGLIETAQGLRLFGAGIVSSAAESCFALDDPSPNRLGFDLARVMRTAYRIDDFQQSYFVIPSFEALLNITVQTDFYPLYQALKQQEVLGVTSVLPTDKVYHIGTQAHATRT
jgi:phenylalanine-4-hydroxylase